LLLDTGHLAEQWGVIRCKPAFFECPTNWECLCDLGISSRLVRPRHHSGKCENESHDEESDEDKRDKPGLREAFFRGASGKVRAVNKSSCEVEQIRRWPQIAMARVRARAIDP
jgi:hypothetical protein